MTADGVLLVVGGISGTAITVGFAVWGMSKDKFIAMYKRDADRALAERDEWKGKYEDRAQEIHDIRDAWNDDRVDLERLKAETNFAPIEKKLNDFIESQTQLNFQLLDSLKKFAETQQEQATMFRICMEKLVPTLSKEIQEEQQKELHAI